MYEKNRSFFWYNKSIKKAWLGESNIKKQERMNMKKLLGVSIAAMLAVSPMLANAAVSSLATTGNDKATLDAVSNESATTNVATTSYVKGAYNAIAAEHNKVVTAVNNIATDINVAAGNQVQGGVVLSTNSVAQNLVALDNAVKSAASNASTLYQLKENSTVTSTGEGDLHYISAGDGVAANLKVLDDTMATAAQTIGGSLNDLQTAVGGLESSVGTFDANGNNNYVSDSNSIQENLQALDGALDSLDTRVNGAETAIGTFDANGNNNYVSDSNSIQENLQALDGELDSLDTRVNSAETAIGNLETTMGSDTLGTTAQNVTGAINELNTAIGGINTASANYATKLGVVATINNATASATVPVYGTWNSENSTGNITVTSDVESAATNKYFGTLADTTGTAQTDPAPAQPGSGSQEG